MEVASVYQGNIHRGLFKLSDGVQTGKPTPDYGDVRQMVSSHLNHSFGSRTPVVFKGSGKIKIVCTYVVFTY